jgi:aminoglycoside 3-N-acetyltransferase I
MNHNIENIQVRVLKADEVRSFIQLIEVFEQVFEMENFIIPDENHLSNVLGKTNFKAVVARIGEKIVGGATIYVLDQYYSIKPLAYIYDLAVLKQYQRQGIGRIIINHIREYFSKLHFEEVFVQADEIDDYALEFYRKTQPTEEEKVRHFYYRLHKNDQQ